MDFSSSQMTHPLPSTVFLWTPPFKQGLDDFDAAYSWAMGLHTSSLDKTPPAR